MGEFSKWLKRRRDYAEMVSNPADNYGFGDAGAPVDYERAQKELFHLAFVKYPEETNAFLSQLSKRDDEIKNLHNRLTGSAPKTRGSRAGVDSEIVPAVADTGYGDDGGDE